MPQNTTIKPIGLSTGLYTTVWAGFLCLFQAACQPISDAEPDTQEPTIAPEQSETKQGTKKTNSPYASSPTSVAEMSAPRSSTMQETHPGQPASLPGIATAESFDNSSSAQPTSEPFTIAVEEKNRSNGVRNFVIVTIEPSRCGMELKDFFITTTLSNNEGTARGSSGKEHGRFVYNSPLDGCNLETIFFKDVNCLGVDDTSFTNGKAVSFKIEIVPGTATQQNHPCMITIEVLYTGSPAQTVTKCISLTATLKSFKKQKKTSPSKKAND